MPCMTFYDRFFGIEPMKTKLITSRGYAQLYAEHDHLWRVERPETTRIVTWAASLGDRSENADGAKEPLMSY